MTRKPLLLLESLTSDTVLLRAGLSFWCWLLPKSWKFPKEDLEKAGWSTRLNCICIYSGLGQRKGGGFDLGKIMFPFFLRLVGRLVLCLKISQIV